MDRLISRFKKSAQKVGEVLEVIMAALVLFGVVLAICSMVKDFGIFQQLVSDTSAFRPFLEEIFVIVIGIEFFQMLCKPNSDNVLEVLIFLVARHMIVGETTPFEDFISVVSVGILCVLRRYLHLMKGKEKDSRKESEHRKEYIAEQNHERAQEHAEE